MHNPRIFNFIYLSYHPILPNMVNIFQPRRTWALACAKFPQALLVFALILASTCSIVAQATIAQENVQLTWDAPIEGPGNTTILSFDKAVQDDRYPGLPFYAYRVELRDYSELSAELRQTVYEPLANFVPADPSGIQTSPLVTVESFVSRRQPAGWVRVMPIRRNPATGGYERLRSFELVVNATPVALPFTSPSRGGQTSVLADGVTYKVAIAQDGVHKIDRAFLQSLGVDVANIDPRNIQVYGNIGGMLPEKNIDPRPDDLMENAVFVLGEADGRFDEGDYILFYAEGASKWNYATAEQMYLRRNNLYSTQNYYFIKIASTPGKRIANRASLTGAQYSTASYDARQVHEVDATNLLDEYGETPSGKEWYGEAFLEFATTQTIRMDFVNVEPNATVRTRAQVAAQSVGASSTFSLRLNNGTPITFGVPAVNGGTYDPVAQSGNTTTNFVATGDGMDFLFTLNANATGAKGWLNFICANTRCRLDFNGHDGQMDFRDRGSLGNAVAEYSISNASGITIWDVTDIYNVENQEFSNNGGTAVFGAEATNVREFIAFDGTEFLTPTAVGLVPTQNLHGISTPPNLLIVYHPNFEEATNRLAEHRRTFSGYTVLTVSEEQIFNEFSSGRPDVCAIRDFCKMLYDRDVNGDFRFLLLMGDGSFDFRNLTIPASDNTNFILTYQTQESLAPTATYNSDDFYTLLDVADGNINQNGMDITAGRFPVETPEQANQMVEKLIGYETDVNRYRDWKNRLLFCADDGDSNLHEEDGDDIAQYTANTYKRYNMNKIYFDAFPQIATAAGARYPQVNQSILGEIFRGTFIIDYMGHGGVDGWAHERVFTNSEISTLNNCQYLPLFVTATCTFAPFDNPTIGESAGEKLFLNPSGGAIALMSTTRLVYASSNKMLTQEVFERIFDFGLGQTPPTIGEVIREAKEFSGAPPGNSRKFALLGDPSMTLTYPRYGVETTHINGEPVVAGSYDTLRARQVVTVRGNVLGFDGLPLTSFNGIVYPTVFDKSTTVHTLVNDPESDPFSFQLQKSVIYKGRATVTNGAFQFTFVVPNDINYDYGIAKISYYAEDGISKEANGFYEGIVVGGSLDGVVDNEGPEVKVFMNDDKFAFGGVTNNSPVLLIQLSDENGINTTGAAIGHDITSILDQNPQETYVLNDFYQAALDDYTRGEVRYPLSSLSEGRHTVSVKGWDTYNNSGDGYTEFIVASSAQLALENVLNYPNPFTTHTEFQFEHNFPGQTMDVQIQIFTIAGRLVKTINSDIVPDGFRVTGIEWDGLDEYGDRLGRGVYVYKVTARTNGGDGTNMQDACGQGVNGGTFQESAFQKLVILR